jgi:hypothetical protein
MQSGILTPKKEIRRSLIRPAHLWSRSIVSTPAVVVALTLVASVWMGGTACAQGGERQHEDAARAALEEYFRAWNAEDNDAVAAISNFPRLSVGTNGQVVLRQTPEEILTDFQILRQSGWDRSTLDLAEAVQVSADKVHFRVVFTRYGVDGAPITTTPGLYVVTQQDGHWGLQLQSVLPPTFVREP